MGHRPACSNVPRPHRPPPKPRDAKRSASPEVYDSAIFASTVGELRVVGTRPILETIFGQEPCPSLTNQRSIGRFYVVRATPGDQYFAIEVIYNKQARVFTCDPEGGTIGGEVLRGRRWDVVRATQELHRRLFHPRDPEPLRTPFTRPQMDGLPWGQVKYRAPAPPPRDPTKGAHPRDEYVTADGDWTEAYREDAIGRAREQYARGDISISEFEWKVERALLPRNAPDPAWTPTKEIQL